MYCGNGSTHKCWMFIVLPQSFNQFYRKKIMSWEYRTWFKIKIDCKPPSVWYLNSNPVPSNSSSGPIWSVSQKIPNNVTNKIVLYLENLYLSLGKEESLSYHPSMCQWFFSAFDSVSALYDLELSVFGLLEAQNDAPGLLSSLLVR